MKYLLKMCCVNIFYCTYAIAFASVGIIMLIFVQLHQLRMFFKIQRIHVNANCHLCIIKRGSLCKSRKKTHITMNKDWHSLKSVKLQLYLAFAMAFSRWIKLPPANFNRNFLPIFKNLLI